MSRIEQFILCWGGTRDQQGLYDIRGAGLGLLTVSSLPVTVPLVAVYTAVLESTAVGEAETLAFRVLDPAGVEVGGVDQSSLVFSAPDDQVRGRSTDIIELPFMATAKGPHRVTVTDAGGQTLVSVTLEVH